MKRRFLALILALILSFVATPLKNVVASTQDFYFKDFTADYYLTKAEDGTSRLHVKEVLTAIFPEIDQNHGINREIPIYNQGKKNRTIENKSALNLTILRNGEPEKINKIEDEGDYYNIYIGSANTYVHGEQVYTLEYDFTDVITEFDNYGNNVSGQENIVKAFQELYWDTNGTGWRQSFGKVTARLHMPEAILKNVDTDVWCYVGSYGEKGEDRCEIERAADGFTFTTENLDKRENLTYAVTFRPDTFAVIIKKSYILVWSLIIEVILVGFVLIKKSLKWKREAREQRNLYHSLFVTPQYQVPENKSIHVAEGEQVYLKKTRPSYVATLLELVVQKAVTITKTQDEKQSKKSNWAISVNVEPAKELSLAQIAMLKILAGKNIEKGSEIIIKRQVATKTLAGYAKSYKSDAENVLSREGYLIKEKISKTGDGMISTVTIKIIILTVIAFFGMSTFRDLIEEIAFDEAVTVVGVKFLPIVIMGILIMAIVVGAIITARIKKYAKYTNEGIRLVRYLEGLELYIKMAEKDRLAFLQSVKGADTSSAGIVKLYEKLLPWASLFGVEESWLKELGKYYQVSDAPEGLSTEVLNGVITSNMLRDVSNIVRLSTNYSEPGSWDSGGGGSSFSSGGGGGGFSGGGGGGGGGGGW